MRRRMGAAALETDAASDSSVQTQWRAAVAARLPSQLWPQRRMLIPAVDAHTGEPVVFDRDSGVDLVDAVAASTSNGFGIPPYSIGGNRYIDGGYRRNENADLAAGYARVLVLSPFGGRSRHPLDWGMHLAAQVDELRARGSSVETIFPDSNAEHMFGANAMDLSLRPAAARAGYNQGSALPSNSPNSGADGARSNGSQSRRRSSARKIASVPWRCGQNCANAPCGAGQRRPGTSASTAGASSTSTSPRPASTSATTSLVSATCGEQVT